GEQAVARPGEQYLHADHVEDAALVLERRDGDLPAAMQLAEEVLARHADGLEEDLVELRLARHLAERADRDARALHVEEQAGDALAAAGLGVGPAEEHAPVGVLRERRPHLLAGHLEVVVLGKRGRAQRRQVGAGAGLGEAEAPEVLGGQDAAEEAALLRLVAVRHDGRAGDADPEVADHLRRPRTRHLLGVGDLLGDGRLAAAVLPGPRDADPARAGEVRAAGRVALDTEFVWERTYRPKLGVVQVATDAGVAVIDAVELHDLSPFFPVLHDPRVPVVLHGGAQDLEIFASLMGEPVRGVVDTQIEGAFLGYGLQVGLSTLLERVLKVHIKKDQTYTHWDRRPLRREQLAYAAEDVLHLLPLHDRLRAELEGRGR